MRINYTKARCGDPSCTEKMLFIFFFLHSGIYMKQDALQARGDAMKERLVKQVVMVLLFAVAMLLADHSHIDVLQRGSEAIRMQMAAEYTG